MRVVTVRKMHFCASCKEPIEKGQKAKVLTQKFLRVNGDGTYYETSYYHLNCRVED